MVCRIISAAVIALTLPASATVAQQVTGTVTGTSTDPVYSDVVTSPGGTVYHCRPDLVQRAGNMVRICQKVSGSATSGQLQGNIGAGALAAGAVAVIAIAASDDT